VNGKLTQGGLAQIGVPTVRYDELHIDLDKRRAMLVFEGVEVYEWLLPTPEPGDVIRIQIVGELPVKLMP
jgi:hypothetical protein